MTEQPLKGTAALTKGLSVLRTIAEADAPVAASQIAERNGLPLPTLQRILASLVAQGLVVRVRGERTYRLGPMVLGWAQRTWEDMDVRTAAEADIRRLAEATGETVHLAVLAGLHIVHVDRRDGLHPIRLYSAIGKTGPIHCTALGKAMAACLAEKERERLIAAIELSGFTARTIVDRDVFRAHLIETRERGFAIDDEEHQDGVFCVAAPILDYRGRPAAGISITAPTFRTPKERLLGYAPMVVAAAHEISARIGGKTSNRTMPLTE